MKKIVKKYNILIALGFLALVSSCEKVNLHQDNTFTKGLLNFAISIPGEATAYEATKAGPYQNGDTIYVEVPTTEEAPLDVTKLKATASLENNSSISPALGTISDFTQPQTYQVKDGEGNVKQYIVKVLPMLPKATFKKIYFKNAQSMGIGATNISGLTIVDKHILVSNLTGGLTENSGVRVYDMETGAFKKLIKQPATYCMQVEADDANHFVINRYNIYSAGFVLYYYDTIDSEPKVILNYNSKTEHASLGRKVTVTGNLKQGKAYVYATTPTINSNVYSWEFNDGVVVSETPTIISYAAAAPWTYAIAQRSSTDANADMYLSYCNYVASDTQMKQGSRFVKVSGDMKTSVEMKPENHFYKILDFKVFQMKSATFLVMLTQGFYAWDATHIKIFDITNPNNMQLIVGDTAFKEFSMFNSEAYGGTNYNRYGDIAVQVVGKDIWISASMATDNATTAGVMLYKMTYNR